MFSSDGVKNITDFLTVRTATRGICSPLVIDGGTPMIAVSLGYEFAACSRGVCPTDCEETP